MKDLSSNWLHSRESEGHDYVSSWSPCAPQSLAHQRDKFLDCEGEGGSDGRLSRYTTAYGSTLSKKGIIARSVAVCLPTYRKLYSYTNTNSQCRLTPSRRQKMIKCFSILLICKYTSTTTTPPDQIQTWWRVRLATLKGFSDQT
ncbi:hypothetical protein J6590_027969 [Homalodisca vitripennis]|nr:hypothetical protein J6590_027969 [Homalodisca vitripennis]